MAPTTGTLTTPRLETPVADGTVSSEGGYSRNSGHSRNSSPGISTAVRTTAEAENLTKAGVQAMPSAKITSTTAEATSTAETTCTLSAAGHQGR
jgi:hypothetical protein